MELVVRMADKPVSGGRGPIVESLIVAAVVLLGCEATVYDLFSRLGFSIAGSHHRGASGDLAAGAIFDLRTATTKHVMMSLMEIFLSALFASQLESLRQKWSKKIRLHAMRLALSMPPE